MAESLETLRQSAEAEGRSSPVSVEDMILHFYCECSDEECRKRLSLSPREYKAAHPDRSRFVVFPGHIVPEYERRVREENAYVVVEKYRTPPERPAKLNPTDLNTA